MKRSEKGIFGLKRSSMLFSFNVRQGEEWPSSDSDDSDYRPDEDDDHTPENSNKNIKKRSKKDKSALNKKSKRLKTAEKSKAVTKKTEAEQSDIYCADLPAEIWLKIFQDVVQIAGPLPFLCRASKVCVLWNELAAHHSLWENMDLSFGWIKSKDQTLNWLCDNRLCHCREVNLSGWKNLSGGAVENLAVKCPDLVSINLSYCTKITPRGITALGDNCKHLSDIDLSFSNVDTNTLKYLVDSCHTRLRQFSVGGNTYSGFNTVLNSLKKCSQLELLDLSNALFSTDYLILDIEKFQRSCPKMKILCLANSKIRANNASNQDRMNSSGFPALQELSIAVHTVKRQLDQGVNDQFYERVLKMSHDLKLLDLRGLYNITSLGLASLPVTDLESLYLAQTSIASKQNSVDVLLHKWRHSLRNLDLSWNAFPSGVLDEAFEVFSAVPTTSKNKIQWINFAGTSISLQTVRLLLEHCEELSYMNLSSCRALPRGMKKEYINKKQISQLKEEVFNEDSD